MRHRGGKSSLGFEISKLFFSELLNVQHKSKWHVGNDIIQCILCGKCESACSLNAISVSRHNRTWTLNNMRCNQCLTCIVSCPKRCLTQVNL